MQRQHPRTPTRPPQTGDRRPRSPDPSISSGEGETPLDSITKSPHTARVIKRGRTGPDATPAVDANRTTPNRPAPIPVYTTPDSDVQRGIEQGALALIFCQQAIKELETVLATARTYRQLVDEASLLLGRHLPSSTPEHATVLSLASELRDIMQPVENPTPAQSTAVNNQPGTTENGQQSPTTFAEAVKAQHERAPPQAPRASKPKRPTSAPNRTAAKPRQRTAPSTRLVVDLAGSRPTKKPHPDSLCRAINDALDGRLAVSAVSTSRNGNLVLHATAPACSAQALAAHHALIWKTLAPLLGVVDATEPPFFPADPWHKVVFHRVPLMQPGVLPTSRDFVREVAKRNQLPGTQYRIGNVRFLHGRDSAPQEEVTVRVDFIEEVDARRFLREGIFLFGSHCRATRYRPRATNGGRPSGGN
ncbi:hypothetical protein B0H11DRAFT_1946522 [Mycena galericulata]|nr:hypothetical protein B0H11DRAFT_1946522 [Mycena galericulata]